MNLLSFNQNYIILQYMINLYKEINEKIFSILHEIMIKIDNHSSQTNGRLMTGSGWNSDATLIKQYKLFIIDGMENLTFKIKILIICILDTISVNVLLNEINNETI